ncbi:MAG: hypothetical protein AAF702_01565 [Chloroflexota bacterium]
MSVKTNIENKRTTDSNKENKSMNTNETIDLGVDLGMGAIKLYGVEGGLALPSFVGVGGRPLLAQSAGVGSKQSVLQVKLGSLSFYVGQNAHSFGRPVENLDYSRLTQSPEITALFYGAMTEYMQTYGEIDQPISIIAGLPLEMMGEDNAKESADAIRKWMKGEHTWDANGTSYQITVANVKASSQPVGALMDFLLNEEGGYQPGRKSLAKDKIGVISVGFNTIEILLMESSKVVHRMSNGSTFGVRRLLELLNPERLYSLGELNVMMRAGNLDLSEALPVWQQQVLGEIEKLWGKEWKRCKRIIIVGGGSIILGDKLWSKFQGKAHLSDDPVQSISRGLYKMLVKSSKRGK